MLAALSATHDYHEDLIMRFMSNAFTRQLLMGLLYLGIFLFALTMYYQARSRWAVFPYYVNKCSPIQRLPVQGFSNTDELKYHIMPTHYMSNTQNCTIVTLGVGKDVEAEKSMQAAMPHCQFWGADPVNSTNAVIFPEVGKFYNIAVGAENGTFRSYVLEDIYRYQEVKYVDLVTFLRDYVQRPVIDQIMIDIEHAEYPLLPFFLREGELAIQNITICQMNIEIHRPTTDHYKQFFLFFQRLIDEEQWALLSASSIIGHLRLFMVNHGSEECHDRYIGNIYMRGTTTTVNPYLGTPQ